MGDTKNSLDEQLRRTRRQLSRRIMKALREGRLPAELKAIEREGKAFWDEAMNGSRNSRRHRGK